MFYRTAAECRDAGVTYHLVPSSVWAASDGEWYTPEAFDADGFIHCTNGIDEIITVANMFYTADSRTFELLVLDVPRIESDWRYDVEGEVYPHIYGPLNTSAVIGSLAVERDSDGRFVDVQRPDTV